MRIIKIIWNMLKNLKKYIVGEESETYAVSLVDEPAIEENFMFFKKIDENEKLEIALDSNEKHLVCGAVLVPDRPIYRRYDDEEFYVEFTKEAIEKQAFDFLKNYRQFNTTIEHEEEAPQVYLVETWLKSDMEYDKSIAMGLNPDLPIGTWFATFKVNNVDVWERIKNGELRGFSVESMISLEEVDFSKVEEKFEEEQPIETPIETPQVKEPEPQPQVTEPEPQPQVTEPEPQPQVKEQEPNHLEELVNTLKAELDELKSVNSSLVGKVKELERQPSVKPVNVNAKPSAADSYATWREQMRNML